MMQNYQTNLQDQLYELRITSFEDNTNVSISFNKRPLAREILLSKDTTLAFALPNNIELVGSTKSYNVLTIMSNKDITVLSLNQKFKSADTTIVHPDRSLGTEYWLVTPDQGAPGTFKEFAIIALIPLTSIDIHTKGELTLDKQTYAANSVLTLTLEVGQAVQLQSVDNLTGTKIISTKSVAVLTGHTCALKNTKCDYVGEQLLPGNSWGTSYQIAPLSFQADTDIYFVMARTTTKVNYQVGEVKKTANLNAGQVLKIENNKDPVTIVADNGIQVICFGTGGFTREFTYDTYLMTILSTNSYCKSYYTYGRRGYKNYAIITIKTTAISGLTASKERIPSRKWKKITGTDYSYAEHYYGDSLTSLRVEHPSEPFGLQSIGIASLTAYGSPGTCTEVLAATCQNIQCEKSLICKMVDGTPKCVSDSVATCVASGDPHYINFNGIRFNFQGTCSYTIAKSCGDNSQLPSFNVEAKNKNRGNTQVSYVSLVRVQAFGHTIAIYANDYGQVRVNGTKSGLTITLADGKMRVYQSGMDAVVVLDFGLIVRYDWNHKLRVELASRYTGSVCGMCGKNDKNKGDVFVTPSGTQAANPAEFGKSWMVDDGDLLCTHNCSGQCKQCSPGLAKRYETGDFCGLINAANGTFSQCHAKIEPQVYFDNCVFDTCLNNGDKRSACEGVTSYANACQRVGATIADWRTATKCPLDCGPNSQYKLCGTACPNTCEDDTASTKCTEPCLESCECNTGFVLTLGKCVPKSTCGCTYKGLPYTQNQVFWDDNNCERQCTCNPTTKQVECKAAKCKTSEKCGIENGVRGCHPASYGTCVASGDPHYSNYIKLKFDFQGTCVYQFSGLCNKTAGLADFQVNVQNNHRVKKTVSFTEVVECLYNGQEIKISRKYPGQVMLNSQLINLPYSTDDNKITMYKECSDVVIKTDNGMKLTYDWKSRITLTLPSTYAGSVCGLCGEFNGDKSNDLTLRGGGKAPNPTAFADSWKVRDTPGCTGTTPTPTCSKMEALKEDLRSSRKDCGLLLSKDGPFRDCHLKVDPEGDFNDCVYDYCFFKGKQVVSCQTMTSYAASCQAAGGTLYPWRTKTFCPMTCPENSHYEVCVSSCPITCRGPPTKFECVSTCKEGCTCNDGYVLSGDQCVSMNQCGCVYNGQYYKKDEVFFPNGKCEEQCTCDDGGLVTCKPFSCGPNEECKLADGIQKCYPVGSGTCIAAGDPHFLTLDGLRFDFQGNCTYTLAKPCGGNKNLLNFEVNVKNEKYGNKKVTVVKVVTVKANDQTLTMRYKKTGVIEVNDVQRVLPISISKGNIRAYQHGTKSIIEIGFGLKIQYDWLHHVMINVPASYKSQMCGLCGNFNGDKADEMRLPDGRITTNINEFGTAWTVPTDETCNLVICGSKDNPCISCNDEKKEVFKKKDYCGFLTDKDGPLSNCYDKIKPDAYFENCVYDVCAGNGDTTMLCHNIQSYVAECQAAGGTIKPWRSSSFCPLDCPANSAYKICSDICSTSCSALVEPPKCPDQEICAEGCECDNDFFFDGQRCVTMDKCGCYENGIYYEPGVTILSDDCSQSCMCNPNDGLLCESHSCTADEKCAIEDGVVKCINKDPCKSVMCRAKEDCKLVDGKAQCIPQFTRTCWAWGDPHHHTLDTFHFSFQGTCTYLMSKNCGNDSTLEPFSFKVKNENRGGKPAVSYAAEVHMGIYGMDIAIRRGEFSKIRVNGELVNLPYSTEPRKIRAYQSGLTAVVKADNGIAISYDWHWQYALTLPSSYYGSTCGLCGNFNQNAADDMADSNGVKMTDIVAWAASWKVYDRNPFCFDVCPGVCPTCDESKKNEYRSNQFCGMIDSKEGPFRECHATVNPQTFVDSCLYDVCMNDGAPTILCQALSAYAKICLNNKAVVYDWRTPSKCPLPCPANSHYEACGNACPASCLDRDAPSKCTDPCIETCQCDNDFILSGDQCVAVTDCGCSFKGMYYKPNEEFWEFNNCEKRCKCDPKLGMVVCQAAKCKDSESCSVVNGIRDCFPTSYATCSARGHSHFSTCDGKHFDFMGTCRYLLVGMISGNSTLTPFTVTVQNERQSNKAVSYTKEVTLSAHGKNITMSRKYPRKIQVGGVETNLPFYTLNKELQVFRSGFKIVVYTDFQVKVTYDGNSRVTATLPSTYSNAVSGLWGNYNGNPSDDMTMKDGGKAPNAVQFGDSWMVGHIPGCEPACTGVCPSCSKAEEEAYKTEDYCGIITKANGPFSQCHETIETTSYFDDCVFDTCQNKGHQAILCSAIKDYVAACQAKGIVVKEWRTPLFCSPICSINSHYELCGNGCPPTCYGLVSPDGCNENCTEGCFCDSGYLLSGDKCVLIKDCGCTYMGSYYQSGQNFYPSDSCQEQCKCTDRGVAECVKTSCGANEECKVVNGVRGCHPSGFGICVAAGDPHLGTLDKNHYEFQGTCTYILATVCGNWPGTGFSVVVDNEEYGTRHAAVAKSVLVSVFGQNITLERGKSWEVKVDQETYALPASLNGGNVKMNQEGNNVHIRTSFGMEVLYDGMYYVQVTVPNTYKNHMCGLCGNFNDDPKDDFMLPNGKTTQDVDEFGEAWKVAGEDSECTGCGNRCPVCSEETIAPFKTDTKCGMITSVDGPFHSCHSVINPTDYFNNCIYDMCAVSGNKDAICNSLQAYVAACQHAGAEIQAWRETAKCPLTCSANSHYEICTHSCDHTCAALLGPTHCSDQCYEGCECDGGYVFDGQRCVTTNDCGCLYNGRYMKANTAILTNGCTESCTCSPGGALHCEPQSCSSAEECLIDDGVMQCVNTATCKYTKCEKNDICKMIDGKPQCVPDSVSTCIASGDPHYKGYDGRRFNFQGTCTYTISKSCGTNNNLPSFNVEAKNQNRGNKLVSYVSKVMIQAYGINITLYASDVNRVWINNVRSSLPISQAEKKIQLYPSGKFVVVETIFGLKMYYDWDHHLIVQIRGSYNESLCGLCGNNNNNPNDDFPTPDGTKVPSAIEFAKIWKVQDGDQNCWDDCNGPCVDCIPALRERYKADGYCGLITKAEDGPFSQCHSKVDPSHYLESCVYDVCLNNGNKPAACQGMKVYANACQREGVTIGDWRTVAQCPLQCGPNSQYKVCGTACPNTCEDDTASIKCTEPCLESCECNAGYVLTLGKCVPKSTCGCTYKGLPYSQNQVFWDDDNCERQCTCNATTKQVKCKAAKCKTSEKCGIENGVRGCHPASYGTCVSSGAPHYVTLDNRRFDFQGNCVYQFSGLCNKTAGLADFQVNVQNNHRVKKTVSFTDVVEIVYNEQEIKISKQYPGQVMLNSQLINLPYSSDNEKITMYKECSNAVIQTDNGMKLTYDWLSRITLTLPSTYAGSVCGLCGDFNGDKSDDLTLRGGGKTTNPTAFGESWKVRDTPGCTGTTPTPTCSKMEALKENQRLSGEDCGLLLSKDGPFRDCHLKVDPEGDFNDCVYDYCFFKGKQVVSCQTMTSYAASCQAAGGTLYPWRTKTSCPMTCPENSHYEVCVSSCPITCSGPPTKLECVSPCKEGCTCNDSYVLSGDQCVSINQCGCVYNGQYYKKDEVFFRNRKCEEQCTCEDGGLVTCKPFTCGPNEECKLADGIQKCYPVGSGTCIAAGDPHFITLDGLRFDFQGNCTYILAKPCGGNKNLTDFEVIVKNEQYGQGKRKVTAIKVVTVKVYDQILTLTTLKKGVIEVNGVTHALPVNILNGKIRAYKHGVECAIETDFNLTVHYNWNYLLMVEMPVNYKGEMCGLCGNFNGDKEDDLCLPDGRITTNINEFGTAWADPADKACNQVVCGSKDNPCISCNDEKKEVFKTKDYCGFLTDKDGPLSNCYDKIKPDAYFENCVHDMCAGNGDTTMLCQNIQSYAAKCQAAGVTIKPWRSSSFCR